MSVVNVGWPEECLEREEGGEERKKGDARDGKEGQQSEAKRGETKAGERKENGKRGERRQTIVVLVQLVSFWTQDVKNKCMKSKRSVTRANKTIQMGAWTQRGGAARPAMGMQILKNRARLGETAVQNGV